MPYRSMSLEEFAKHVCMDARELRKMAVDGELPAHKVAGKWRFHRAHVTEWLQQRMPTLSVIKDLDVFKQVPSRFGPCSVATTIDALLFHRGKEAFDTRVVVTVTPTTHRTSDSMIW